MPRGPASFLPPAPLCVLRQGPDQVRVRARAWQRPCSGASAVILSPQALVTLLQSDRFRALDSIIIYCHRRRGHRACRRPAAHSSLQARDPGGPMVRRRQACASDTQPQGLHLTTLCLLQAERWRPWPRPTMLACAAKIGDAGAAGLHGGPARGGGHSGLGMGSGPAGRRAVFANTLGSPPQL